jgi:hypothetical protein
MKHSLHWSLLAVTALALLLMTPLTTSKGARSSLTFATVTFSTVRQSLAALAEFSETHRPEAPEAATLSLLLAGAAGAWCVRRRNSVPTR